MSHLKKMHDIAVILKGFLVGMSLIVAIGAQNAFVLRQGLKREHIFPIVIFCLASDILLITIGVTALHTIEKILPSLASAMGVAGIVFLLWYGFNSFRFAFAPLVLGRIPTSRKLSLKKALLTCLAVTYLNPHVYLDTIVLLGGLAIQYHALDQRICFGIGAILASFLWFFALGYGSKLLAPLFQSHLAWKILDCFIGTVMWTIAVCIAIRLYHHG